LSEGGGTRIRERPRRGKRSETVTMRRKMMIPMYNSIEQEMRIIRPTRSSGMGVSKAIAS
jgi:hypothetical protein